MARSFNGTSDQIDFTAVNWPVLGLPISFSAWILTSTASGTIIASDTGGSPSRFYQFKVLTHKLVMTLFLNSATVRSWTSATSVDTGVWVHCGGSYDGTAGRVYVNGTAEGAATLTANTGRTQAARIGAQLAGVTQSRFTGTIGEVAIWNRTVSAGEMSSLAQGLTATHLAPLHYWPLWGDSGEVDIGTTVQAIGTLTGTTLVASPPVTANLFRLVG